MDITLLPDIIAVILFIVFSPVLAVSLLKKDHSQNTFWEDYINGSLIIGGISAALIVIALVGWLMVRLL